MTGDDLAKYWKNKGPDFFNKLKKIAQKGYNMEEVYQMASAAIDRALLGEAEKEGVQIYLFDEEIDFIKRAKERQVRRAEMGKELELLYNVVIGQACGDEARENFVSLLNRTRRLFQYYPLKTAIVMEWHIYNASWLPPSCVANYFSDAKTMKSVPEEFFRKYGMRP